MLRQLDNGTLSTGGSEGLLYVTLVMHLTEGERMISGTVCDDGFDKHAARIFCENIYGYHVNEPVWGSFPHYPYVSKYVFSTLIIACEN